MQQSEETRLYELHRAGFSAEDLDTKLGKLDSLFSTKRTSAKERERRTLNSAHIDYDVPVCTIVDIVFHTHYTTAEIQ